MLGEGALVVMGWEGSSPWPFFSGSMSVEVLNVGGWLTHGDMVLDTCVDFLAVVEHRLVPARVRGEWARLRARGASSVSGLLLLRNPPMLVMVVLVLSVCAVLPFLFLLVLLPSLRGSLIVVGL